MKTRVITAIVMVALMVPFFIWSHTVAFPILMAFLGALGAYEMQSCIGSKKQLRTALDILLTHLLLYMLQFQFFQRLDIEMLQERVVTLTLQ